MKQWVRKTADIFILVYYVVIQIIALVIVPVVTIWELSKEIAEIQAFKIRRYFEPEDPYE